MAQHDYTIANQGFPATRQDLNNVLDAIRTNNSGTTPPSEQYAGQFWIDTTSSTWTLYIHDGADDIQFATIDTSANTVNFIDSELADGSVTNAKLGADAVDGDKIADDSIDSEHYVDGSIDTAHIADSQITTAKINDDAVTTAKINDDAVTTAKINDNAVTNAKLSFNANQYRNIIINGDMSIAQRGTSSSSITTSGYYTVDRFNTSITTLGTWTQSQSTDVPSGQGFSKSLKMDCTTADGSPASGDRLLVQTKFEGQNLQYLKKGTANAESLTCSFWVKSNKTGTYIVEFFDSDNTRQISKSYTIDSASTWEKKTITIDGDTTGTLDNDNNNSLGLSFYLGAGSNYTSGTLNTSWNSNTNANRAVGQVNLADSTSNEWYLTGVQLEAGTTASDFEFLPYDVNLRRCYRYYWGWWDKADAGVNATAGGLAVMYTSTTLYVSGFFPVTMRATPSLDQASGTNYYKFYRNGAADDFDDFALSGGGRENKNGYEINNGADISGTAGQAGFIRCNNVNAYIFFDAEL